jgi:hypothetical protein
MTQRGPLARFATSPHPRPASESLHAVVDRGGDHHHGDGEYRHADEDGPDASTAIADDGAKHERDLDGRVAVPSTSRLR